MIIGVSGKSGAGKSCVSKYLESHYGFKWIDTDKIARKIRENNKEKIVSLIGNDNILKNGNIDSKLLGEVLFENKMLLDKYNEFIYLELKEYLIKEISRYDNIVLDSMFLPIMDVFFECDYKILVECDELLRKNRILKRDNISDEYFKKRDKNGLNYNKKDFDFVIINNDEYQNQIDLIVKKVNANYK